MDETEGIQIGKSTFDGDRAAIIRSWVAQIHGLELPPYAQLLQRDQRLHDLVADNGGRIDFNILSHAREINRAILEQHFGIKVNYSSSHLLAPVPARLAYVDMCLSLVAETMPEFTHLAAHPKFQRLQVLDIGTGSLPIFPLLLSARYPHTSVTATDIDPSSLVLAQANLNLNPDISVSLRNLKNEDLPEKLMNESQSRDNLIPFFLDSPSTAQKYDFIMTNPPFYKDNEEMLANTARKEQISHASFHISAQHNELVYPGGEVAWLKQLIADSQNPLCEKAKWYTSMIAFEYNIEDAIRLLRLNGCDNYFLCRMHVSEGSKTRRYIIGWSWDFYRLPDWIARMPKPNNIPAWFKQLPPPNEAAVSAAKIALPTGLSEDEEAAVWNKGLLRLCEMFEDIEAEITLVDPRAIVVGFKDPTWQRRFRRQRQRDREEHVAEVSGVRKRKRSSEHNQETNSVVELSSLFKPSLRPVAQYRLIVKTIWESSSNRVWMRWMWGPDRVLWESFSSAVGAMIEKLDPFNSDI